MLKYWNILPKNVKMSESVNSFKANLENYKVRSLANVFHNSTGHFWDVSEHIMDRIGIYFILKFHFRTSFVFKNSK